MNYLSGFLRVLRVCGPQPFVRLSGFHHFVPTVFYTTFSLVYVLILFICLISLLLFPCATVGGKTRA